ncbi:MAG: DegT/DnrJ/EryC1/StrS family aminotransferase [archaeon]|nr:DegT/DnrJ/EryC1/StrS family aminotransferase [archaeon]
MSARIEFGFGKLSQKAKDALVRVAENTYYPTALAWQEAEKFADDWGKLFEYKRNVAVASGTAADIGSLFALYNHGAKRGDEVIVPALAWISVINAPLAAGFKPVFVDVEKETLNINPRLIKDAITDRTKAIMVVHTMGKPCEMDTIKSVADERGIYVIEDACEAHGAKFKNKYVGQWGDMATFSFYMAHLVWAGEGGMVSTNNSELADSVMAVRNHGRIKGSQYMDHFLPGLNLKMSDFHAAIGRAHLEDFWTTFNTRKDNLDYLLAQNSDLKDFAWFNSEGKDEVICPHGFSVTLKDPKLDYKGLYKFMQDNSINCKRNFGSMPTQHRGFQFLGHKLGEFPEAEYIGDNGLHIGVHQGLNRSDLDHITETLHTYFNKFK